MLLLGPKGSGKTLHGRLLAKKFGVFHISFKDRLQELIIHKMRKKIGPDFEFDGDEDVKESTEEEEFGIGIIGIVRFLQKKNKSMKFCSDVSMPDAS